MVCESPSMQPPLCMTIEQEIDSVLSNCSELLQYILHKNAKCTS
jgi:hypothetical protein